MKTSWFFGDSSTFGHGLRSGFEYHDRFIQNKKPLWTELVSNHYNSKELNFGLCGASNEDIKFRITTNLYRIKKDDIVFIQYTHPSRINVFDSNNDYRSIHIAFNYDTGLGNQKENHLRNYVSSFVIPSIEKYEIRDFILFLSLKKEIESKGATCILWSHELISETFRQKMKWESIYDESNGSVNDKYHLGFNSQKSFYNFLINEFDNGNTIIKLKNINEGLLEPDEVDCSIIDTLYKDVRNETIHKHFDESDIFI